MPQSNQFRPMRAEDVLREQLRFPFFLSPKGDGVRGLTPHGYDRLMSRSLKPIPNMFTNQRFRNYPDLDGELIVPPILHPASFNRTQSAVMSRGGNPDTHWLIFDLLEADLLRRQAPFIDRLTRLKERFENESFPPYVQLLEQCWVNNPEEFDLLLAKYTGMGYEGVVIRDPDMPYKFGTSTVREQGFLRLKTTKDAEAEIVGWKPLETNTNAAQINELGYTKRSSAQAGKVQRDTFGSFLLRCPLFEEDFWCGMGPGLDEAERDRLWNMIRAGTIKNWLVKFRFNDVGVKDRPRFPRYMGLRSRLDMPALA